MSEDWAQWSRDAVSLMSRRNDAWQRDFDVSDASYRWSFDPPELFLDRGEDEVAADICVVGTTSDSEGTFLWAWANEMIPESARQGLDQVQMFGHEHDLPLLTEPEMHGGLSEGKESAAIAGRIQSAARVFIHSSGDMTLFFTLHNFRVRPK